MDIPIEYILRKGFYEVSDYFKHLIEDERIASRVPVLVKDRPMETIFFVECDVKGIPKRMYYEFLTLSIPRMEISIGADFSTIADMTVFKKTIIINDPILTTKVDSYSDIPDIFYFLWEGELMENVEMDIAKLDVKYLQQLSQEAIKKREPIILDEVIKNKLIK